MNQDAKPIKMENKKIKNSKLIKDKSLSQYKNRNKNRKSLGPTIK